MVENKSSLFGIIAIIIGASGLGLGAFSIVNFQLIEGPQGALGDDGVDGIDGQDAPGGLMVWILDPDNGETVVGNVTIRALVYGSENYTISILQDGTEIGTYLPFIWDTTLDVDDWYNITVRIKDIKTNISTSDEVLVYVENVITGIVPADGNFYTIWHPFMLPNPGYDPYIIEVSIEASNAISGDGQIYNSRKEIWGWWYSGEWFVWYENITEISRGVSIESGNIPLMSGVGVWVWDVAGICDFIYYEIRYIYLP